MYGWTITQDHLYSDFERSRGWDPAVGTTGPSTIPPHLEAALETRNARYPRHVFRMYDDDGVLYYTGHGVWDPEDEGDENALVGPLRDFGTPNAGAVTIKWQGHPEWDCEWA